MNWPPGRNRADTYHLYVYMMHIIYALKWKRINGEPKNYPKIVPDFQEKWQTREQEVKCHFPGGLSSMRSCFFFSDTRSHKNQAGGHLTVGLFHHTPWTVNQNNRLSIMWSMCDSSQGVHCLTAAQHHCYSVIDQQSQFVISQAVRIEKSKGSIQINETWRTGKQFQSLTVENMDRFSRSKKWRQNNPVSSLSALNCWFQN